MGWQMTPRDRLVFSVIIPTRNRAALFKAALQSVLDQRFTGLEVIVINDGSSEEQAVGYHDVLNAAPQTVRLLNLVRTDRGHGQSYALNYGVAHARGDHVCFLDDDDQWTDPEHLSRAADVIAANVGPIDLILANQKAFRNGVPLNDREIWIEELAGRLKGAPDSTGAYTVQLPELLLCQAHCHLNTTIVRRAFYLETGGLDEGLRYECDRDFYFRAVDRARTIKFLPNIVSRHNVPDPLAGASMSTSESEMSKRLYQLRVLDKAVLFSTNAALRRYAMQHRVYVLEYIAREAGRAGRPDSARYYRWQGLVAKLVVRWAGATRASAFGARSAGAQAVGGRPDDIPVGRT